ncbi:MAG: A/G-specific adenine glycosylase [Rhodobacterales bacterium]|jgi:A/G-specific adenine glycosylase
MSENNMAEDLLSWYDVNARDLPWRISPGDGKKDISPNPYYIWMSEIMLQQTTVAAVKEYFIKFTTLWPTVFDMAEANDEDVMAAWAGLGYYARARNLLKCARIIKDQYNGKFPCNEKDLLSLPGIGPYTAAAIMSIAFDEKAIVLDGNIERVMSRIYAVEEPLPNSKKSLWLLAAGLTPDNRPGDYAQAVMDLGATVCTPRSPKCDLCPWNLNCLGLIKGIARDLPFKVPKLKKPTRVGIAYVAINGDQSLLLERRPDKGLLGGMLGWPGSDWAITQAQHLEPLDADWITLNNIIRHTFTHFHLELTVKFASNVKTKPRIGEFLSMEDFNPQDLPTVMRKVWSMVSKL